MKQDYETLSRKTIFFRACRVGFLVLLICAVVVAPALWCWGQSIEKRHTLREAKNVVANMNLLGIEEYGFGESIQDKTRESGLSRSAEEEVRSRAGVDGKIYLIMWDTKNNSVSAMNYQRGRFLVEYRYDESEDEYTWDIYWNIQQYDN